MSINIKNDEDNNHFPKDVTHSGFSNCLSSLFNQLSRVIVPFHYFSSNTEKVESIHSKKLNRYKEILKKELRNSY
ncbi:MAG: hypothetical protein GF317_13330 [Candidatus Lokiarchaeota archaeon]|nr:hypothetical protein [Candidatus Lokiarchaeota archaeon]MBD3200619.1 hypothetical protein [Candidatus Lokiarchaeota archaeon]